MPSQQYEYKHTHPELRDADLHLMEGVMARNVNLARTALRCGANVDGSREVPLPFTPLVAATVAEHPAMVNLLLEHGADPDRPVCATALDPCPANAMPGERALHIAARSGNAEIVQLLLERSGADLKATDDAGYTPLMAACGGKACVEVVRLLLEAGSDPALADERGFIPLHVVAGNGCSPELVDMLYSKAPATLNHCVALGQTPLTAACNGGHERIVSKLLSLGATQLPPDGSENFPLVLAAKNGAVGVVRTLLGEGGTRAVGGGAVVANALYKAVSFDRATVLRLLLTVDGENRRTEWANTNIGGRHLLHYGAGFCCSAVVSSLLEAGACAASRDIHGRIPVDVIGEGLRQDGVKVDRGKKIAIRRMLQRPPAYRARSWAWPSGEEPDAGGSGDVDTSAAATAAAAASVAVASSRPAVKIPVINVRMFRPKDTSGDKFFVTLISR